MTLPILLVALGTALALAVVAIAAQLTSPHAEFRGFRSALVPGWKTCAAQLERAFGPEPT